MNTSKTTGVVCTVPGGTLGLWVIARLSSAVGQQQTWAPPFAPYEWMTLVGAVGAAALLIVGLIQWTSSGAGGETHRLSQVHAEDR